MTEKYTHLGAEVFADDEWSGQGEFVVAGLLQGEDWKMIQGEDWKKGRIMSLVC